MRAVRQTRASAHAAGKDWRQFVRESTEPAAKDGPGRGHGRRARHPGRSDRLALRQATGNAAWDAGAAIVIGAILAYVAYQLGRNYKDLLIGAGARPEEVERIRRVLESHPGVDGVLDLRTMYIGPESLLVAARVDLAHNGLDAEGIERLANELDERLRREVPAVSEVFLDPTPRTEPEPSK